MSSFNKGDRVRINNNVASVRWRGLTGVVKDAFGIYVVFKPDVKIPDWPTLTLSNHKFDLICDESVIEEDWS